MDERSNTYSKFSEYTLVLIVENRAKNNLAVTELLAAGNKHFKEVNLAT